MEDWMTFNFSTEDCFSPDPWSSGSSPEGSLPLTDIIAWAEDALDTETNTNCTTEEEEVVALQSNEDGNNGSTLLAPSTAPEESAEKSSRKGRIVFSEKQLNILLHRFNLQTHLKPREMEELAEMTGLSYKQVKTWFQNRRATLRRRHKAANWCSENQHLQKDCPLHGLLGNIPPHVPHFQGEGQPPLREHYSQAGTDTNTLHATLPAGSPSWTPTTPQSAVHVLPQMVSWSVPQTFPPSCLQNPKCDEDGWG